MELTNFAQSLFDQFEEVDGRGDFEDDLDAKEHTLNAAAFENLLVYLGVLDPVLAMVEDSSSCLSAMCNLGDKVGKITRIEAAELFKKRVHITHARAPTASRIRDSARTDAVGKKDSRQTMTKPQFEACMAAMIEMLQDKAAKANNVDPFGPLPPEKKKARQHRQPQPPADEDDPRRGDAAASKQPESTKTSVAADLPETMAEAGGVGGDDGDSTPAHRQRPETASPVNRPLPPSFRSIIKTPVGRFIRISNRRAATEPSSFDKLVAQHEQPLPLLPLADAAHAMHTDSTRPHTARADLISVHSSLVPHAPRPKRPLKVGQFGKLLHVAPLSASVEVQELAAPAVTALAMSANDGKVLNQFGAVGVMLGMLDNPASPKRVVAEALQCLKQLVKTDAQARSNLIAAGGLKLLFNCRHSSHVVVRKNGIATIETLLLQYAHTTSDSRKPVLDCYSDDVLANLCEYLSVQPREVGESAGKLLVGLSRTATARGNLWESLRPTEMPFRIDARGLGHRRYNGIRQILRLLQHSTVASGVLSNISNVAAASAMELAQSRSFGTESKASTADLWRRSTSAGNLQPKHTSQSRILSASRSGSLSARSFASTQRSVLYHSQRYDSNDYSTVGSVGYCALEAMWAPLTSAEHAKVAIEGLLRDGFLEVIANIVSNRRGLLVQEEDRLLLKTLARTIVGTAGAAEGVLPPAMHETVLNLFHEKRHHEPFVWLTSAQMKELVKSCRYVQLEAGAVVAKQGHSEGSLLLVLSGALRMQRHVSTSNATSELGQLEAGGMFGLEALLLGEARSATLTVVESGPAEVLELTFGALALLVHDYRLPSDDLVSHYIHHVLEHDETSDRIFLDDEDIAILACPRQILEAQARRGIFEASTCLPRLLQILLASMPDIGKYQENLKVDIEAQTQATLIILHLVTKFPYARTVYESGLLVPILRLISASEPNVAKNASAVVEGLVLIPEICATIGHEAGAGEEEGSTSSGANRQALGDLLIACVLKKIKTTAEKRMCDNTMLNCLKKLINSPYTCDMVVRRASPEQALQLLQASSCHSLSLCTRVIVD